MNIFRKIITIGSILFTSTILAGTMEASSATKNWPMVLGLSAGPTWTQGGKTQTFYLQSDLQKTYTANRSTTAFPSGELFLGLQKNVHPLITGQFGIAIAATGSARLIGDIWEDGDPDFNNFTYAYKNNHTRVALKGRLIGCMNCIVQPYIHGSLGVGFNRAYQFVITPRIPEELPAPPFTNNTKASLSYTLGAGIQKNIFTNWQFGVGYEFADWGKSELGRAPLQTLNQGLSINHLYVHQLQFTVSRMT